MQKINYLIVDDEPQGRKLLQTYMAGLEGYHLMQLCATALEAYQALQIHQIDFMFLDVKMPQVTGVDLLRSLKQPPPVILTTAYSKYALEGYELNVVDYLLKPIALPRLLQALEKLADRLPGVKSVPVANEHLFVKIEGKLIRINTTEILLIEGMQNYIKVHLPDRVLIVAHTMKEIEILISHPDFLRVHRSYLLPLSTINSIKGNIIETNYRDVPIGASYRSAVMARLGNQ